MTILLAIAERGVPVRVADFAQPESLPAAFAGAAQVLVISVDKLGETARQLHRAAIGAARAAGAQRILYTNHMAARADSLFAPAADHAATEALLAEAGVAFTALRHGFYAESALHLLGNGLQEGVIRAPEDGPVSWTTRADLAAADALLLTQEGRLEGITPPLTAPQAFTMADLAAIASELTGREIKRVTVTDERWRDAKVAQGVPAPMARCCWARTGRPSAASLRPWTPRWRRCSAAARTRCATCSPAFSSPPKPRGNRPRLVDLGKHFVGPLVAGGAEGRSANGLFYPFTLTAFAASLPYWYLKTASWWTSR